MENASLRAEIRKLASLGLPVVATQVSTMLLGFVDTVMVGRVSVDALAAVSLGNVWVFGTLMFANGVVLGLDPLLTHAHGRDDGGAVGLAAQRGLLIAGVLSIAVAAAFAATEPVLLVLGQDPALARAAARYALVQIPSIPFFLAYGVLRQYLQARELVRPAMWVILIANVFNALFNWVLIFGHLGFPRLEVVGAGIATGLTRGVSMIGLILWIRAFALHHGAWPPLSRHVFEGAALRRIVGLGVPVAIQVSLEMWAFSAAAILAGLLGALPLAAHTIALNMAALAFMVPLGISQGAVTRVGNLLGAGDPPAAQHAAWVALGVGAGVMAVSAAAFVAFRHLLPRVYTDDAGVVALCASILPIAACFQVFDGIQVVGCGVLRGMGRTRPAAFFNLIGYWLLGLPIGAWLAFPLGWGLAGIWWGLALGLLIVALLLIAFVRLRGPATVDP